MTTETTRPTPILDLDKLRASSASKTLDEQRSLAAQALDELRAAPTGSVECAAQALGISRAYAYTLVKQGVIPVIRLGAKRIRVPSAAILRMIDVD